MTETWEGIWFLILYQVIFHKDWGKLTRYFAPEVLTIGSNLYWNRLAYLRNGIALKMSKSSLLFVNGVKTMAYELKSSKDLLTTLGFGGQFGKW